MINRITRDTWELWVENIEYIIQHTDRESVADEILIYLENEEAFTVVDD